jgi:outer membrane protein insertion porin family
LAAKPVIQEVIVTGPRAFSEGTIRSKLHSKKTSAFDFLPFISARRLRRDSDRQDSVALHNWYRSQGYLDVHVNLGYTFMDSLNRTSRVEITVREGVQTLLADTQIDYPPTPLVRRLDQTFARLERGAPLNPFLVKQVQFDINEAYANAGHPYAAVAVDTSFTFNRRQVNLRMSCRPGPEVRFGQVRLPDLRWTRESAVRRELAFRAGDLYSRRAIVRSEDNLFTSGLFDYVALDAVPGHGGQNTKPDFELRGIERKPLFVNARTGGKQDLNHDLVWSTLVVAGDRNFTGRGRLLRVAALADFIVISRWQELKYRFSAAFTEPWPIGLRLPTTLELAYEPGVQDVLRPYRIQRVEGSLSILRRWSRKTRAWLVFTYEQVDISDLDPAAQEQFRADSGISTTRSVTLAQRRDARDAPLSPTRGSVTAAEIEYAGGVLGGDNNFNRVEGSWTRYYRGVESWNIIAHRIRFGYLEGTGADDRAPSQELYFLGGANTVRGFKENSIGPKNTAGDAVGGQFLAVGNLELRRPVVGRLWMSLFVDVGNLWDRIESFRWTDWRVGAGGGLQFMSPVGPIRLDYGRRVIRDGEPPGGQFHLSIGYAY